MMNTNQTPAPASAPKIITCADCGTRARFGGFGTSTNAGEVPLCAICAAAWNKAAESTPAYWNGEGRYQTRLDQLTKVLVPTEGKTATFAGELLRVAGNVYADIYNNGGGNLWDTDAEEFGFSGPRGDDARKLFEILDEVGYLSVTELIDALELALKAHNAHNDGPLASNLDSLIDWIVCWIDGQSQPVAAPAPINADSPARFGEAAAAWNRALAAGFVEGWGVGICPICSGPLVNASTKIGGRDYVSSVVCWLGAGQEGCIPAPTPQDISPAPSCFVCGDTGGEMIGSGHAGDTVHPDCLKTDPFATEATR